MCKEYNYCLRCGRKLKREEYRQLGYGKTCYAKIQEQKKHSGKLFEVLKCKE